MLRNRKKMGRYKGESDRASKADGCLLYLPTSVGALLQAHHGTASSV